MHNLVFHLYPLLFFIIYKRAATYLHYLQQDEYNPKRFLAWLISNRAYDRYNTCLILGAYLLFWPIQSTAIFAITALLLTALAIKEPNPTKKAKKPLVLTHRALRIYILTTLIAAIPMFWAHTGFDWILIIQAIPFIMATTCIILLPIDKLIHAQYRQLAENKLKQLNSIIIGITGSYGKTTTKHILNHLLQKYKPTLMTPGSVNTPMGIAKIINEQLNKKHHFFIVEMGAYNIGSIQKICNLTPPQIAMVTSIGPCHLERFKSIENIVTAKSEILEACKNHPQSLGYCFPDELDRYERFAQFSQHDQHFPLLELISSKETTQGITLTIKADNKPFTMSAPIYGKHQAKNILIAVSMAHHLGMPLELIQSALVSLKQVPARLEVKQDQNNITWINDGFNANPEGFKEALSLLDQFGKKNKGRRILITPGITELAEKHDEIHSELAKHALEKADIIIAVATKRIQAFIGTCQKLKQHHQIFSMQSFSHAKTWLDNNQTEFDTILFANDLPDLLESKPNI